MSNDLSTILSNAIRMGDTRALREMAAANPAIKDMKFTYSYTQEYGSDGCWDRTIEETTSIIDFIKRGIYRPGNRSYGYALTKVGA